MDIPETERSLDVQSDADFASLMLNRTSLEALARAGFTKPSPVQSKALLSGMLGLDLLVQAKSGTGKTLVFTLLAVQNLNAQLRRPQVLIVAPTREIAAQIASYIKMLAATVIHVGVFVGGNERGVSENIQKLKKNVHIVVGTTGRLTHLVRINALDLSYVRLFVLDEADKLMEDCFQREINYLFSVLPSEKQVTVFSATYPHGLDKTLTKYMRDVHLVRVDTDAQLRAVKQYVIVARNETRKMNAVFRLLLSLQYGQCIIFASDRKKCEDLFGSLREANYNVVCISGEMSQSNRTKAMKQLKNCRVKLLVSTDLISRGIDAPNVNIVINYGVPNNLATYLHRIGRTGRFGTKGGAFTIISSEKELKLFSDFVVEGKLEAKLLRAKGNWPDNLIYNDQFFNTSESFRPYISDKPEQLSGDPCVENYASKINEVSTQLGGPPNMNEKTLESDIAENSADLSGARCVYYKQDFFDICNGMKNAIISDTLANKLAELKIRAPLEFNFMKENALSTLLMKRPKKKDLKIKGSKVQEVKLSEVPMSSDDDSNNPAIKGAILTEFDLTLLSNIPNESLTNVPQNENIKSAAEISNLTKQSTVVEYATKNFSTFRKYESADELISKLKKVNSNFHSDLLFKQKGMIESKGSIVAARYSTTDKFVDNLKLDISDSGTQTVDTDLDVSVYHEPSMYMTRGKHEKSILDNNFDHYARYMRRFRESEY